MVGKVLVTGGTGYVGGRLIDALERHDADLRCLVRRPDSLRGRVQPTTDIVQGDALDAPSLATALAGVHTAFYLVHSMGATSDFADLDRRAARTFGDAAREAGVRRIVYLGGLGDASDDLSAHLRSRHETGAVLRESGVPVIEFRASIVIGSGSLSFEMVRALTERLPVMICPRWVDIKAQPIAIDDVVAYLVASLDLPDGPSRIFEIGGPDVVSYGDIMQEYARQRGLRRLLIPVPFLTPHLSSLWLGLVTPIYARVGRKLISSIRNATVVRSAEALTVFPIRPHGLRDAIARAIAAGDSPAGSARWSDARSAALVTPAVALAPGPVLRDERTTIVAVSPASAFAPIRRIGGDRGWYAGTPLWRLRGAMDLLAGGVGMRRGRRDPEWLRVGDPLDFWRVQAFEADRRLRLEAEMKVPGRAWLSFDIEPLAPHQVRIRQTASFQPSGVLGRLYWYALLPVHAVIFSGMLRGIARRARLEEQQAQGPGSPGSTTV
ncbi:MAG: SDR family oxidoreductase [Acidobacteria bacterium]|nr:SDR family oxidoreductase [Acidobacteriota bacterium]